MALETEFTPLALADLHAKAAELKEAGWRFVQTHAVNAEEGIDLYYSFMKDGKLVNYVVAGVGPDERVESVTDLFLAAFPFENEARELFGVNMGQIAIDFGGNMYTLAESEPMTFMSPQMKAEKEKQKKVALAREAKLRKARAEAAEKEARASEAEAANVPAKDPGEPKAQAQAAKPRAAAAAGDSSAVGAAKPARNAEEEPASLSSGRTDDVISALEQSEAREREKTERIVHDIVEKGRSESEKGSDE